MAQGACLPCPGPPFLIFILLVLLLGIWKSSKPVLHILILCWTLFRFLFIFSTLFLLNCLTTFCFRTPRFILHLTFSCSIYATR